MYSTSEVEYIFVDAQRIDEPNGYSLISFYQLVLSIRWENIFNK